MPGTTLARRMDEVRIDFIDEVAEAVSTAVHGTGKYDVEISRSRGERIVIGTKSSQFSLFPGGNSAYVSPLSVRIMWHPKEYYRLDWFVQVNHVGRGAEDARDYRDARTHSPMDIASYILTAQPLRAVGIR
jgi:hypothetical protein